MSETTGSENFRSDKDNIDQMDMVHLLSTSPIGEPINCVDMHTCGEPTRIIIKGFPNLSGTLLEQRSHAKKQHDRIRRRLMLEPRGHRDMYGAILRCDTEEVRADNADIGVLFTTNDGYSTMCGHATIALGRFLVDTHDPEVFPRRHRLKYDATSQTVYLRLHCPCGVVGVTVPTTDEGVRSDPSRPVSFVSVDSFATGIGVEVQLSPYHLWPTGLTVVADFTYGGAFYALVSTRQLPFLKDGLDDFDMDVTDQFTKIFKATVNGDPNLRYLFHHPQEKDLSFLYSVILVDNTNRKLSDNEKQSEVGLCYFSSQQVDRSPTGSGVSARLAAAYATNHLSRGESRTYHSLVSLRRNIKGAFKGTILEEVASENAAHPVIKTKVEGYASYTGVHISITEPEDILSSDGFLMDNLAKTDQLMNGTETLE